LLQTKDEVLKQYKFFEVWVITQQHCSGIKVLHSDSRGKYLSKAFDKHLVAAGIARQLTIYDMPQLNGVTKWLNQMLLECIHAL
jgi:transposase InsO family protein